MALPAEKRYTYADYLEGTEEDREELIDGFFHMLASPTPTHQRIVTRITRQLANYLEGRKCEAFSGPIDVRLFEQEGDLPVNVHTVVVPDVLVVCDPDKVDEKGIKGAPDFIVEVLSPSTRRHDAFIKANLYQRAGVREYWMVDPESRTVNAFTLEDGRYIARFSGEGETLEVQILPGCAIDLNAVFAP